MKILLKIQLLIVRVQGMKTRVAKANPRSNV